MEEEHDTVNKLKAQSGVLAWPQETNRHRRSCHNGHLFSVGCRSLARSTNAAKRGSP